MDSDDIQKALRQKEKELYSIQKIGQALSSTLQLDDLLLLIIQEITQLMDADRGTLYLVDHAKKEIWSKIALKAEVKEIRQKFGVGISGYVAATGETLNIPEAYQDIRFDPTTDSRTGYITRSILCMPVWEPKVVESKRQIVGVIQVLNKKSGPFTKEDEGILAAIGSQVAISLANARLYQQLEKKYREIDLLHQFEQMLSAEFDVREVLKKMLQKTVEQLQAKRVGVIYFLSGKNHLLGLEQDGKYLEKQLPRESNLIFKTSPDLSQPPIKEKIENYFEIPNEEKSPLLKTIKVISGEKITDQIILVFQALPDALMSYKDGNSQVLEIVGQKMVRALEIHQLRENLLRQERLSTIGQMMSTIVHDLRSPINSIYGFTELLTAEGTSANEIREYTDIILQEIQLLSKMIREILDFAKGRTVILPRKCSANEILKRFEAQAEQLFRNSRVKFDLKNTSRKTIHADVEKFTRVLYNISKNAKEAMKDSGSFLCKVYDGKNQVVFELKDDGPGIPEEISGRLFESFVSSGKEGGTGLGLAIVKKIVDDHHGEIEIKSEIGKGTTFFIKLPEYQAEDG